MKQIAVGNLGNFWYGDYKEPFVQLEGAVDGHPQGVVLKDDAGLILCAYCGKTFSNLGNHVRQAHGMSTREYKNEVGLLQKSSLVSEGERVRRIRQGLRVAATQPGDYLSKHVKHRGKSKGSGLGTVEYQNKTGRCYAQMLAVGRSLMARRGRVTIRDMRQVGISYDTVEHRFGSWRRFVELVGDERPSRRTYTVEELKTSILSVAKIIGRTPTSSDMRRYGMPSMAPYRKIFGSWAKACASVGLLPTRFIPGDSSSEASMLATYATVRDIHQTARICGRHFSTVRSTLERYGVPIIPPGMGSHAARTMACQMAAAIAARLEGVEAAATEATAA